MNLTRRWSDRLEPRPWSSHQLRRLGKAITTGQSATDAVSYADVVDWHNRLIFEVLPVIQGAVEYELDPIGVPFSIGSRAKTLETLRDKLERDAHLPLQNIQDLAGVRVIADMGLRAQAAVAERVARDLRQSDEAVVSRLDGSHAGYRALHVVCVFRHLGGARLEVQIRTDLQNSWANLYDALADRYGREIRYGTLPADAEAARHVQRVQGVTGFQVVQLEQGRDRLESLRDHLPPEGQARDGLEAQVLELEREVLDRGKLLRRTMEAEAIEVRRSSGEVPER